MKITVRRIGDVSVLDLNGRITIGRGDVVLREGVLKELEDGRRKLVLNLVNVSYMDSAGLGELAASYKRIVTRGGAVRLLNPTGKVYDLLQLTKLEEVFPTFRDEKEALVSF